LASVYSVAAPPNVIIVLTDDQGYGDLGCHGNPVLKTPHIDRLHAESVRFTDFHVSPFCTPTRAALMTGNHAGFTGAFRTSSGRTMMHRDEKTVANLFADAGYSTGMVGKWHLGDNAPHRPQDRGFEDVVWHRCGGIGQASDYWGNDYFDDTYERNGKFEKFEGYCTDVWFREGMRFVEENKANPFFLYLALNAPHGPYFVPKEWAKPYKGNPDVANPNFFGMIANIDHNMGLLRKKLSDLKLSENTILIFMTDNGTSSGFVLDQKDPSYGPLDSLPVKGYNAGMRGRKSSVYDGGHRVPFFIHWPKGKLTGGKDIDTLAAHIDVLPTLAELCGIEVAKDYRPDGISLKPLLDNDDASWKREHLVEQYIGGPYGSRLPPKPREFSVVMTERWRLVHSREERLFDIQADPTQSKNVAAKHPEVVSKLRELYDPFWQQVSPRLTAVSIDIGNPNDNPTVLCSQDWRMPNGNPPWHFNQIKKLPRVTGPWMIEVKNAGRYRITLRQFPEEADKPVVAVKAELDIAGKTLEQPVEPGSRGVVFETNLPAGPTQLVTRLFDENGKAGGAYFTEVEAL
jgi:arylsulfatase A-like enzyme